MDVLTLTPECDADLRALDAAIRSTPDGEDATARADVQQMIVDILVNWGYLARSSPGHEPNTGMIKDVPLAIISCVTPLEYKCQNGFGLQTCVTLQVGEYCTVPVTFSKKTTDALEPAYRQFLYHNPGVCPPLGTKIRFLEHYLIAETPSGIHVRHVPTDSGPHTSYKLHNLKKSTIRQLPAFFRSFIPFLKRCVEDDVYEERYVQEMCELSYRLGDAPPPPPPPPSAIQAQQQQAHHQNVPMAAPLVVANQPGSLMARLVALETAVVGQAREGSMIRRVKALYGELVDDGSTPTGGMSQRLARLEKLLWGSGGRGDVGGDKTV
jgi:hypothetical protein